MPRYRRTFRSGARPLQRRSWPGGPCGRQTSRPPTPNDTVQPKRSFTRTPLHPLRHEGRRQMDFSRVSLSHDEETFLAETHAMLSRVVTDDVRRRDRETGDNFNEEVHLALGAA